MKTKNSIIKFIATSSVMSYVVYISLWLLKADTFPSSFYRQLEYELIIYITVLTAFVLTYLKHQSNPFSFKTILKFLLLALVLQVIVNAVIFSGDSLSDPWAIVGLLLTTVWNLSLLLSIGLICFLSLAIQKYSKPIAFNSIFLALLTTAIYLFFVQKNIFDVNERLLINDTYKNDRSSVTVECMSEDRQKNLEMFEEYDKLIDSEKNSGLNICEGVYFRYWRNICKQRIERYAADYHVVLNHSCRL